MTIDDLAEPRIMDLLSEMDKIADALGWAPATHRSSLAVELRLLQKRRTPVLSAVEREYLLDVFGDHYTGRQAVRAVDRNARAEALCARHLELLQTRKAGADRGGAAGGW